MHHDVIKIVSEKQHFDSFVWPVHKMKMCIQGRNTLTLHDMLQETFTQELMYDKEFPIWSPSNNEPIYCLISFPFQSLKTNAIPFLFSLLLSYNNTVYVKSVWMLCMYSLCWTCMQMSVSVSQYWLLLTKQNKHYKTNPLLGINTWITVTGCSFRVRISLKSGILVENATRKKRNNENNEYGI